jgi:hypothetical protein
VNLFSVEEGWGEGEMAIATSAKLPLQLFPNCCSKPFYKTNFFTIENQLLGWIVFLLECSLCNINLKTTIKAVFLYVLFPPQSGISWRRLRHST